MTDFRKVINIVPLARVALASSQFFTYLVPLDLVGLMRPGQLVRVPFGKREIFGVTSSPEMHRLAKETKGLKSLGALAQQSPIFEEKSLNLANWLSRHYVTSLGLVLKAMLPPLVKKSSSPEDPGYERHNPDFILTEYQRQAVAQIGNLFGKPAGVLLYGVTGSGKTEVYMQLIERLLENKKQILVMVPEISLTDAAIERFSRRFGKDKIAVLHSKLKGSQRLYAWQKIRDKEASIVIGPRSAVFAPFRNLGLIIIDEEHDASYKQYDQNPKYHARTVAEKLSQLWNCPLILGDATPALETYYRALKGELLLLSLPYRIKADAGMPKVKVVDMREEQKKGGSLIFSDFLKLEILEKLKDKKQIILFLNRRGTANFMMCRDCGFAPVCKNCEVSLVWHHSTGKLLCHHCGKSYNVPPACPKCQSVNIGYYGIGTQRVEEELKKFLKEIYPGLLLPAIARMDRDSTIDGRAGSKIYQDWVSAKIQILVGTQMISKGWDVSRVGLVGIISADTLLHLPDFRTNERTFQVLTQVAGRTGRGQDPGMAILQTFSPESYTIEAVKLHDYDRFFRQEIRDRQKLFYPPFARLAKLVIRNQNRQTALEKAGTVAKGLLKKSEKAMEILGPVPAFITKRRGQYQFQIFLRYRASSTFDLYNFLADLPSDVDIDVDPDNLL